MMDTPINSILIYYTHVVFRGFFLLQAAKMMFQAVNAQMKKMLATASDVNLTPREMEKSKHDAYFVKQYSIGKSSEEGKGFCDC